MNRVFLIIIVFVYICKSIGYIMCERMILFGDSIFCVFRFLGFVLMSLRFFGGG